MMYTDPLRNDMRGMVKDMMELAKERNPRATSLRATITDNEKGTWISFRVLDDRENLIANYSNYSPKEQED